MRRQAEGALEGPGEVIPAELGGLGKMPRRDLLVDVLLNELGHLFPLPAGKAAPKALGFQATALKPYELVNQHGAERLGIGRRPLILDLRFQLERGLPDVVVEKEQPRSELDLREPQLRVGERGVGIDLEERAAREHPRILPAVKPVAGGNEAQPATELALGRALEAFHDGLTIFTLGALTCNQHVVGRLHATFEPVETRDFDDVSFDPIPRGVLSTHDIGWV
jgi:hypothetical protein